MWFARTIIVTHLTVSEEPLMAMFFQIVRSSHSYLVRFTGPNLASVTFEVPIIQNMEHQTREAKNKSRQEAKLPTTGSLTRCFELEGPA